MDHVCAHGRFCNQRVVFSGPVTIVQEEDSFTSPMENWEGGTEDMVPQTYPEIALSLARVTSSLSHMSNPAALPYNSTELVSALEHSASVMRTLARTIQESALQNSGATEEDTFMTGSSFDDPMFPSDQMPLDTFDPIFDEPIMPEPLIKSEPVHESVMPPMREPVSPISKAARKRINARKRAKDLTYHRDASIKGRSRRERHHTKRLIETLTHVKPPRPVATPATYVFGARGPAPVAPVRAILGPTGRLMTIDYFSAVMSMPWIPARASTENV